MGKTFNAAQRAARKGKKRQQRKLTAKLHQAEFAIMKFGSREDAIRGNEPRRKARTHKQTETPHPKGRRQQ